MTEQEWLACNEPDEMLDFLLDQTTERKYRLFALACVRRHADALKDHKWAGKALDAVERFIDGRLTQAQMDRGQLHAALEKLTQHRFLPPRSKTSRSYSAATLERWFYAFKKRGLQGLLPRSRKDKGRAKSLAPIGWRKKLRPTPSLPSNNSSIRALRWSADSLLLISLAEESVRDAPKPSICWWWIVSSTLTTTADGGVLPKASAGCCFSASFKSALD